MHVLGKVTTLGVLCCFALFVCFTLLASFFLPSHLSFKNMYICECVVGSSPTRGSSFFSGKVTALGVLYCFALFVCLILLASFFIPSSYVCVYVCMCAILMWGLCVYAVLMLH